MLNLFLLTIWLIVFLISFVKIEIYLLYKSKEKIKEAIQAYREVKKSKQDILDLFKKKG